MSLTGLSIPRPTLSTGGLLFSRCSHSWTLRSLRSGVTLPTLGRCPPCCGGPSCASYCRGPFWPPCSGGPSCPWFLWSSMAAARVALRENVYINRTGGRGEVAMYATLSNSRYAGGRGGGVDWWWWVGGGVQMEVNSESGEVLCGCQVASSRGASACRGSLRPN